MLEVGIDRPAMPDCTAVNLWKGDGKLNKQIINKTHFPTHLYLFS